MKLVIEIDTDNAAFQDDLRQEIADILHDYAEKVEDGDSLEKSLKDSNGNTVGKVMVR